MPWSPLEFATDFKKRWEGGMSVDPADTGNWYRGVLVGSKYGVTGAALAKHRGVTVITQKQMRELTFKEAADVALKGYYHGTGIDRLPWGRIPAMVMDFGYNAGPTVAIAALQRVIGANDDGKVGPQTIAHYEAALQNFGEERLANMFCDERQEFYDDLIRRRPSYKKYADGYKNRVNYFRKGHREKWWERFNG